MRLFIVALAALLAAVALTAAGSPTVAAAPLPNAIVDYHVQAADTWTDPETDLTYRSYTVTVDFTHRGGQLAVQINQYAAGTDQKLTWDNTGVPPGSGTDSITLGLGYGLVGQPVYFKLFLYKPGMYVGKPPGTFKGEVIYDSRTTGTYDN